MPDILISTFNLPIKDGAPDTHTMRAVQRIMAQLQLVADDTPQLMFGERVEQVRWMRQSLYRPDAPYALVSIMPSGGQTLTGDGTPVVEKQSIQIALIFSANDGASESSVQAWASALSERVWNYLDPEDADTPNGIDFRNEIVAHAPGVGEQVWRYDPLAKRRETLDRNVFGADNKIQPITGNRWRYLLEFQIETFPTTPLT